MESYRLEMKFAEQNLNIRMDFDQEANNMFVLSGTYDEKMNVLFNANGDDFVVNMKEESTKLDVDFGVAGTNLGAYDGDYTINPKWSYQNFDTKRKSMTNQLVVNPIPVRVDSKTLVIHDATVQSRTLLANGGQISVPIYDGAYEYTPMVTSQIIQCKDKKMAENVTINPIHTHEEQDSTGGINFEIFNGL